MLILTRRPGSQIRIGDNIVVTLVEIRDGKAARLGIDAPDDVRIVRDDAKQKEPKDTP